MELPIVLHNEKTGEDYTFSDRAEILVYCQIIMDDFRTEKYSRIDLLLDAYNEFDKFKAAWEAA